MHTPAETILAPFLADVHEPAVQAWFNTVFRNWLLKQPENLHQLTYLPPNADAKQQKAFTFNDLYDVRLSSATQTLITHLLDFFRANPSLPRLDRMSVEAVEQAAERWVQAMNAGAAQERDEPAEVKTLMTYPNGFVMLELTGANALGREGNRMGHCVGGYCDQVTSGATRIFSLRDRDDTPHATIELVAQNDQVSQIKGRQNKAPVRRYWSMIRQFLDSIKADIHYDYKNVGLLRISTDDGNETTMTQDQFRDIVLDPANPHGQQILARGGDRHIDEDTALGLFTALYGSDRLTNDLVARVFRDMPDLAVQTVAHRGSHFTPAQLAIAFTTMGRRVDIETTKELLRVTKPDVAQAKIIADQDNASPPQRRGSVFMLALAQELPEVYADLLDGDPNALAHELEQPGPRAAGPFFAFIGKHGASDTLTPAIIEAAFAQTPVEALKRLERRKRVLSKAELVAALHGAMQASRYKLDDDNRACIDHLIATGKPDTAMLETLLGDPAFSYGAKEVLGAVLASARKHVPEAITREVTEATLLNLDNTGSYAEYFKTEPAPGAALQRHLFDAQRTRALLGDVQVIDPALFTLAYETLRPEAVAATKDEYRQKKKPDGKIHNYTIKVPKTPAELNAAQTEARRKAIRTFTATLAPLLREPGQTEADTLDPAAPKVRAARRAFEALHKGALLDVAVAYLNRAATVQAIGTDRGGWNGRTPDPARFAAKAATMRVADIMKVFDASYNTDALFTTLIAHAPNKLIGVIRAWYAKARYKTVPPWGDFKAPLDKEKAFAALERVWESDLPEGYQDRFAAVVLKRFKPSPGKLLSMLAIADNEEVTSRIVKKTAKPSVELIDFLVANFPKVVLDAKSIPPAALAHIFRDNLKLAITLMDRDLRGWSNGGYRYGEHRFQRKIDRASPDFARYAEAASAGGKTDEFARYVHQSELDDTLDATDRATIEANLTAYSAPTLVRIVKQDNTLLPLYFEHFTPAKLALLAQHGLFGSLGWQRGPVPLDGIKTAQLEPVVRILATKKNRQPLTMLARALHQRPLDDAMILPLLGVDDSGIKTALIQKITGDTAKDYVADHYPYEMDNIAVPTAHMVSVLFDDTLGERDTNRDGKAELPYMFKHTVTGWFNATPGSFHFQYRQNPQAARLIKDEAIKRGGVAIRLGSLTFKLLATWRGEATANRAAA